MPVSIGNLTFERPLFMAPMEGITDVPFRKVVRNHGCGVTCTQMVHAEALKYAEPKKLKMTATMEPDEAPVGFQLCSSDPAMMSEAAKKVESQGAAYIDINMGCPAKNVVKRGAGAALLKEPKDAVKILRSVVDSVSIPVTVKIRAGWDKTYQSATDIGPILEKEGAKLISVHARSRSQGHKGKVDWDLIQKLKSLVSIPVVGNGGIFAVGDAKKMMAETGTDGVMVARGALGNPWIFEDRHPTVAEIRRTLFSHFEHHMSFYENPHKALLLFRKHVVWYTKSVPHAAEFRKALFQTKSINASVQMMNDFFDRLDANQIIDKSQAEA